MHLIELGLLFCYSDFTQIADNFIIVWTNSWNLVPGWQNMLDRLKLIWVRTID